MPAEEPAMTTMRLHETVQAVMTRDVVAVDRDTAFKDIAELLAKHDISAVPVVDESGVPLGVVSEADLLAKTEHQDQDEPGRFASPRRRHEWEKAEATAAADLMSPHPIVIGIDTPLSTAARTLTRAGVRRLLVVDDNGRLAGIVARRDLLTPFLRDDEQIVADVRKEVLVRALWLQPTDLDVTVTDGVVTLAGCVERRSEAEIAIRLTHALPGVVAVVNQLTYQWNDTHAPLGTSNVLH
jgi:CBS domain-containing protein